MSPAPRARALVWLLALFGSLAACDDAPTTDAAAPVAPVASPDEDWPAGTVLAVDMTRYLKIFRRNRIAAAAITGLSQTAAAGGLTLEKIEQAQRELGRALAGKPARRAQRGLGT